MVTHLRDARSKKINIYPRTVCTGPHLAELQTCTLDTCRQGILCTHPPIKCVNCDAPYKVTDPECPTRTKIQLDLKAKWQISEPPQVLGGSA
jgi:hypothetical protein